ncbi:hypothetical protein [Metabacillus fastidiosus]|nr:hypothetical protein [Metabacillus fastidiosus]MED4455491.1 hypothetical protein [Metabacillus fastidiosus]MED4461679.1 hypothetical protein [Metabacillus fastidiosus]
MLNISRNTIQLNLKKIEFIHLAIVLNIVIENLEVLHIDREGVGG